MKVNVKVDNKNVRPFEEINYGDNLKVYKANDGQYYNAYFDNDGTCVAVQPIVTTEEEVAQCFIEVDNIIRTMVDHKTAVKASMEITRIYLEILDSCKYLKKIANKNEEGLSSRQKDALDGFNKIIKLFESIYKYIPDINNIINGYEDLPSKFNQKEIPDMNLNYLSELYLGKKKANTLKKEFEEKYIKESRDNSILPY